MPTHAASEAVSAVAHNRANPGNSNHDDWVRADIVLGAVALAATGAGFVVDGAAAPLLEMMAFSAGGAATALNYDACVNRHDTAACGGMVMGALSLGFAGAGAFMDDLGAVQGSEQAEMAATMLNAQAFTLGPGGLLIDTLDCLGLTRS